MKWKRGMSLIQKKKAQTKRNERRQTVAFQNTQRTETTTQNIRSTPERLGESQQHSVKPSNKHPSFCSRKSGEKGMASHPSCR